MKNPAAIDKPKLTMPIPMGQGVGSREQKSGNGNGNGKGKSKSNLPYLKFRRKMRKNMFGRMP